jgi:hypothetical protein
MYTSDPKPWLKPTVYYGRRYIPGYVKVVTLQDRTTGKNIVEFNTYDIAYSDRKRAVYSALPKITNMFLHEYGQGNLLVKGMTDNLLPLSGVTLEVWGYNFSGLPIANPHLNSMSVWVSASSGVFVETDYHVVDRYSNIASLSARNPTFRGVPVSYELIPVIDRSKSTTATTPKTIIYTRKNKLKLKLPGINNNSGCIDIIVANAAGYTTLNTLTNDYICSG